MYIAVTAKYTDIGLKEFLNLIYLKRGLTCERTDYMALGAKIEGKEEARICGKAGHKEYFDLF